MVSNPPPNEEHIDDQMLKVAVNLAPINGSKDLKDCPNVFKN
jgi:hypothetical protein